MKASIIVFSPSGHTLKVSEYFKSILEDKKVKTQLINITKDDDYLTSKKIKAKLQKKLKEHKILFIGGPIYAGHIENHLLQVIKNLPTPDYKYSQYVVPFVTYGGVHSSIALEEMGKHLKKGGRKSILGIKIATEHTLTKSFEKFINAGMPTETEFKIINEAIEKIISILNEEKGEIKDVSKSFRYSSIKERILFHTFSQEFFHKKYKDVSINYDKCIGCKKCASVCPTNMYKVKGDTIEMIADKNRCILCAECFHNCQSDAIDFSYLKKVRERLKDGHAKKEEIQSKIYT